jgi:5-(hydroxymethyl)furfural/furfural oxidase
MPSNFDYIVVGGGSSGCVIASRLTERAAHSVLLLEAGRDVQPGNEPADIASVYPASYFNKSYFWSGLKAHWRTRDTSAATGFSQARVFGGGGAVMGMVALRGTPADYDDWARAGAEGWDWQGVLPYFRKLETDLNHGGALHSESHGSDGPLPIRRIARDRWPPQARAVAAYAEAHGLPFIADMNADFRDGLGALPMCRQEDGRASSAFVYLDAAARRRANLTVAANVQVTKILFEGTRAVGVSAIIDGAVKEFRAREVIVTCGAIFSPALLLRSGIGEAAQLQALGIPVVADRRGVGANLQNHPVLFIGMHLKKAARQPAALRTVPVVGFRYSSGLAGCAPADLYINVQSRTSWNALGQQIGNIAPTVMRPASKGRVWLDSTEAQALPRVEFNFLGEAVDLERMRMVFTRAVELVCDSHVRALGGTPFPVRFTDKLRRLNEVGRGNALKASLIAGMLDVVPGLSDLALGTLTGSRVDLRALVNDREALTAHLIENVAGVFHPVGTCRMGRAEDAEAVVDHAGRVYGVAGLRVADASIMPNVMAGNTNLPVIMAAEKIADAVQQ